MSETHSVFEPTRSERALYLLTRNPAMSFLSTSPAVILLGMLMAMATAVTTTEPPEKTKELIQFLLVEIDILEGEESSLFYEPTDICKSKVALSKNDMSIPMLTDQDRCLYTMFDKVYLKYLYSNFHDKATTKSLPLDTRVLFDILHREVSCSCSITPSDSAVTTSIAEKLKALKRTAMRLILCGLNKFLQYTMRAFHTN
ncbi:interleukin-6-like [Tupaia chinensis]|uniref:interleukin-6-like n=1 Tax=Tupaia chinensis TaxID=246437 RepID=UPI000703E95C|nr:interleukin-6-like [Tupaia chinensis]